MVNFDKGNNNTFKVYVACIASVLAMIVLLITGFLNISSFEKNYINSLASSYGVAGSEARRTIEYSVKFHKPIDNFAGMDEILSEVRNKLPEINDIYILKLNGSAIYDTDGATNKVVLPEKIATSIFTKNATKDNSTLWLLHDDNYHILIPIKDVSNTQIASIDLLLSNKKASSEIYDYLNETLKMMFLAAGITILVVIIAVFKTPLYKSDGQFNKKALMISLSATLLITQITFGAINVTNFRTAYLELNHKNLNITSNIIQDKIEHVVGLGFSYNELVGVDDWLKNLIGKIPEIDHVNLKNDSGDILFTTKSTSKNDGLDQIITKKLAFDASNHNAILELASSKDYVNSQLIKLLIDIGTMLIVSIFFLIEMLFFTIVILARKKENQKKSNTSKLYFHHENSVRALSFLLLLSSYMSISFIPLLMNDIYQPILGLPKNISIGLPIASEMFGAFASSLLAGYFIDKYGWRPTFLSGLICMIVFTALSANSSNPLYFIFIRGLVGLGYGAAWMGLRGLVAVHKSKEERSTGFSILNAGIFAGQNCGAVIGGLLAERIGFSGVFLIASLLALFAIPICFRFSINAKPASTGESRTTLKNIGRFFLTRDNFVFLFLMTIPTAIAGTFLNYFFPLFSRSIDISQGDIGRGFLLYGICIVFLGPVLIKKLKVFIDDKQIILISGLIGSLSLAIFWYQPTFTGALIAIMILGIADSIGLTSQNSYFMNLQSTVQLGYGKSLSFYSAIKKLGQLSGPPVYGVATLLGNVTGIGIIVIGYLACVGGFKILSKK
jgi:MFS family permease